MKTKRWIALTTMLVGVARLGLAADLSLETAPPVVVKTVPSAGATDVNPALTEIKVTYSKAMQDGSWSWSTWGQENYPETTGTPHYLADARTCVLPVKLQRRSRTYQLLLTEHRAPLPIPLQHHQIYTMHCLRAECTIICIQRRILMEKSAARLT